MKTVYSLSSVVLILVAFSCNNGENIVPQKGNVQFGLSTNSKSRSGGRTEATEIPAFVMLSIKDSKGGEVETGKKLPVYAFGQSYISESLQLSTGNYQLTEFVVLDANNKIIYAAPLEGSKQAQYVKDPLPLDFTISKDGSTQVIPQVLAVTSTDTPESFGYVSFGFEVVDTPMVSLLIDSTFTFKSGTISLTNSDTTIIDSLHLKGSAINFSNPNITPGDWAIKINVLIKSNENCVLMLHRFESVVTFIDKKTIALPLLNDWKKFYYSYKEVAGRRIEIYRPLDFCSGTIEIYMNEVKLYYAYADRGYWSVDGQTPVCSLEYTDLQKGTLPGQYLANLGPCKCEKNWGIIDNLIVFDLSSGGYFEDYFAWNSDGTPACDVMTKGR